MTSEKLGVRIKWLSVACFEMDFGGATVVTDPFVTDSAGTALDWTAVEKCDYITLSHMHFDHITDIPMLIEKFDPLLLTGELGARDLCEWVNMDPSRLYPMTPDLELDFDTVKIRALFGRHVDLKKKFYDAAIGPASHPVYTKYPEVLPLRSWGILEYRNYLFTAPNGTRILFFGNEPSAEQKNQMAALKPDIAIMQCITRLAPQVGEFAAAIGCKVLIPHHMDFRFRLEEYTPTLDIIRDSFLKHNPNGTFVYPTQGQWMEF